MQKFQARNRLEVVITSRQKRRCPSARRADQETLTRRLIDVA
jgi:hypothetical protein